MGPGGMGGGGGGGMGFGRMGPGPGPGAAGDPRLITEELMVPGTKCGLVIGKGGETIKQIQAGTYYRVCQKYVNRKKSLLLGPLSS